MDSLCRFAGCLEEVDKERLDENADPGYWGPTDLGGGIGSSTSVSSLYK
jgi:hypothetical protein